MSHRVSAFFLALRHYDWWLLGFVFILSVISFASLYSIDLSRGGKTLIFFPTQSLAWAIGFGFLLVAASLHVTWYRAAGRLGYFFGIGLLATVLFFGTTIRGTRGWFRFGQFSFQPVELVKVLLIVLLAMLAERYGREASRPRFFLVSGVLTSIFAGLVWLQPDMGSAVVLFGLWFGILCLTESRKRYAAGVLALCLVAAVGGWFGFFKDYQKERVLTFLHPERDLLGAGYNVAQSVVAVGSGQFTGRGLGFGSQSQLHFLPEAQTDFVFSLIAEELGFVGASLIMIVYFFLLWRLITIARRAESDFASYLVLGIALLFFIQIILNIGGSIGILPVTGITLPFLSYGGSSLMMSMLLIGLAESVAQSSPRVV